MVENYPTIKKLVPIIFFLFSVVAFSQTTIYSEDFNAGLGGWTVTSSGLGIGVWVNGSNAAHSSGATGNYVYSQEYSKNSNNDNNINYNNKTNIIATSPTINTTGFSNITFQFDIWYKTEVDWDGMKVEYSLNNGTTWSDLGSVANTNWYNDNDVDAFNNNEDGWTGNSGGWVTRSISLSNENTGFNNNSQVKIRILFASDNFVTDIGVAFDNIIIKSDKYCSSYGFLANGFTDVIRRVQFNTIDNSSPSNDNGYSDFTGISTIVTQGTFYNLNVNVETDGNVTYNTFAWIDWNQDGDFNDLGESYNLGTAKNVTNSPTSNSPLAIEIPATASAGSTRMRVSTRYNTNPISCGTSFDGEVEDYTINIIYPPNTWNGSISTDWNTGGNWSVGVPTFGVPNTLDVIIPSGLTNYPIIFVGAVSGYVKTIALQSNTILNVRENSLQVTDNLTLNGKIDLEGESQLLQDMGSVLDATSTGSIEIDQQGEGNKYRYNYWSMPVFTANDGNNYTTIFASLRDGTVPSSPGTVIFNNSGYDGALTSPITLSSYWMFKYANSGTGYSAWNQIRSTGKVYTGQGFTMKGPGAPGSPAQNYVFTGKPNNGTINLTVAANYDYLVGNPYPSAIDADQFIWDNATSITGPIYFWEHYGGDTHNLGGYQGGYATYSLGGSVQASAFPGLGGGISVKGAPKQFIPVGQAFFVVGDADGGQIQFNNGQRVFEKESLGNSIFMKSYTKSKTTATHSADLRPRFRIGFDAPKISHRQLLLTIDERATPDIDWGFDAEIYEVFADDMYWILNNKKYVIQATNEVVLDSEVPLGIQLSKTGMVTVKIDALENVDNDTSVYLKDKLTGETFNMREKSVQLNLTAGKYTDRFALIFKTQKLLAEDVKAEILIPAIAQSIIEGIHVFMNNAIGELQIKNNSTDEITSIALYNYLGQTLKTWNSNFNIRIISLPLSTATGIYFVQINTKTGKTIKKISVE